MMQFLYLSHHPLETLRETNRILKQNGLVVISLPNINSLEFKTLKEKTFLVDIPRHLYDFSACTLKKMLEKTGFITEKIIYFPRVDTFQWSLDSLFQEKGYKIRVESKWRVNPLVKLVGKLLSLCQMSGMMSFYVKKRGF
jgi:SAM-dependent methyltransferase